MYILFGNYGNDTIALIQSFQAPSQSNAFMVSIDTGWQNPLWQEQVNRGEALAQKKGLHVIRLKAPKSFQELVVDRGHFPTTQFQWCANFLKGLPLLNWLDEQDPLGEAMIVLPRRRAAHAASYALTEYVESSEHYGDRKIWHAILDVSDDERNRLLQASGIPLLSHHSLECDLCVNSELADWQRIADQPTIIEKVAVLEGQVNAAMFAQSYSIIDLVKWAKQQAAAEDNTDQFYMGCGAPYVCGI